MGSASTFDYASLKDLLKETNAEVLLPGDGAEYEKSIERWGEQCIKRAVSITYEKASKHFWLSSSIFASIHRYPTTVQEHTAHLQSFDIHQFPLIVITVWMAS
jgi:hypothetical protein